MRTRLSICRKKARYPSYEEALAERGLTPDPAIMFDGLLTEENGYRHAMRMLRMKPRPTALLLSRQTLPAQGTGQSGTDRARDVARGGYVLADDGRPDVVLIATGSEVPVAMEACRLLAGRGISACVVSMPCCEVFDRQDPAWRSRVLPNGVPRLVVEAGATGLWRAFVGLDGDVVGLDRYGESAPAADLYRHFGITADVVADRAQRLCSPQF